MVVLQHPRRPARLAARDRQLAALLPAVLEAAASTATRSLQIFFAVVAGWGWWQWLRGTDAAGPRAARARARCARPHRSRSSRSRSPGRRPALFLRRFTDTDVPWWDAFPTAASVIGQWLLGRKYVENWPAWIVVNVVGAALFAYKGLWLTVLLYAVFVVDGGRRLARLAAPRAGAGAAPMSDAPSSSPCSAPRAPARRRSPAALGAALGRARPARRAWSTRRCASSAIARARTPRRDEQAGIAAAADARASTPPRARADVVVADTTRADDRRLQRAGVRRHAASTRARSPRSARYDLTLVTALDLPWQADGLQRDGAARARAGRRLVRAALARRRHRLRRPSPGAAKRALRSALARDRDRRRCRAERRRRADALRRCRRGERRRR